MSYGLGYAQNNTKFIFFIYFNIFRIQNKIQWYSTYNVLLKNIKTCGNLSAWYNYLRRYTNIYTTCGSSGKNNIWTTKTNFKNIVS